MRIPIFVLKQFANCFRQMFRLATSTTDPLVLEMAAKAHGTLLHIHCNDIYIYISVQAADMMHMYIGHLLRVATALMGGDLIEWDLQQALDPWMKVIYYHQSGCILLMQQT
jgi:hypothetical protein